jgi:hypothetical protein
MDNLKKLRAKEEKQDLIWESGIIFMRRRLIYPGSKIFLYR